RRPTAWRPPCGAEPPEPPTGHPRPGVGASLPSVAVATARRSLGDDRGELRRYLEEVRAVALLTPEQEDDLAATMRAGQEAAARLEGSTGAQRKELLAAVAAGHDARERFVSANLRLVIWVARRYRHAGLPMA